MCGIAGIVSREKNVERDVLTRMTRAIEHRGPDGDGHWINPSSHVGLGHRRLKIIDLTDTGKQPMFYADGRFAITYNGEIYNYIELRQQLEKRGCKFVSTSDTEVLLALFAEKGEACLADLEGMFAFAIWDEQKQRLFVARDRFGEKPFYYSIHNGALYFGSEMKALWAAGVPRKVSNQMLFRYLSDGALYDPSDLSQTFFEGIFKLKAAHYAFVSPESLEIDQRRYWSVDIGKVDQNISEDEAIEQFGQMFRESVAHRLRSDVAVGSSLSGGLDSSLIVCTIDELNRGKQIRQATFSARFPGFAKDEGSYMQAVIDRTNVEPHFVFPDESGLTDNLEKLFRHQEEPFGSASIYAQFCVMELARQNGVTVLLDGQGADELLAGYHPYFDDYLQELKVGDKARWRTEAIAYTERYGKQRGGFSLKAALSARLPASLKVKAKQIRQRVAKNSATFIDSDFCRSNSGRLMPQPPRPSSLNEALHRHAFGGPLEELLRYADRNSMAHSREVRLPFLHHGLAEFIFSLPSHFKIRNGTTKYIMREAFRELLPAVIVNRTDKIGYEPPQKAWFENPRLTDMVWAGAQALADEKILTENAFDHVHSREGKTTIYNSYNWKILMAAGLLKG